MSSTPKRKKEETSIVKDTKLDTGMGKYRTKNIEKSPRDIKDKTKNAIL